MPFFSCISWICRYDTNLGVGQRGIKSSMRTGAGCRIGQQRGQSQRGPLIPAFPLIHFRAKFSCECLFCGEQPFLNKGRDILAQFGVAVSQLKNYFSMAMHGEPRKTPAGSLEEKAKTSPRHAQRAGWTLYLPCLESWREEERDGC